MRFSSPLAGPMLRAAEQAVLPLASLSNYPALTSAHLAWQDARRLAALPPDISFSALAPDLFAYMTTLDIRPDAELRFLHCGRRLCDLAGRDLAGCAAGELFDPGEIALLTSLAELAAISAQPNLFQRSGADMGGASWDFVALLLPLCAPTGPRIFLAIEPSSLRPAAGAQEDGDAPVRES